MTVDIQSRRNNILRIVINTYVYSGAPVSSRSVCSRSRMGLCTASIRNVMADLEDMGLLTHLHTSAGRVPTDKGYRFYVDNILEPSGLTSQEQVDIDQELLAKHLVLEEVIAQASRILSDFTNYAAVVSQPVIKRTYFKFIQFTLLTNRRICVTFVANTGATKSSIVTLDTDVDKQILKQIENFMNAHLENVPLNQLKTKLRRMMIQERNSFYYVLQQAAELIDLSLMDNDKTRIYFEGLSNILSFPDFDDLDTMRALVKALDEKKTLANLMQEVIDEQGDERGVRVFIGKENPYGFMGDCTVVLSKYRIDDETVGGLGIIGPRRMNYGKAFAAVDHVSKMLSEVLTKMSI